MPHLPTPRRAALKSAGQKMKSLRARRQPLQIKHDYYMAPETPLRSVKYLSNITRSTTASGNTKKMNPTPEAKKSW